LLQQQKTSLSKSSRMGCHSFLNNLQHLQRGNHCHHRHLPLDLQNEAAFDPAVTLSPLSLEAYNNGNATTGVTAIAVRSVEIPMDEEVERDLGSGCQGRVHIMCSY
jgi:hypothetical protein